MLTRRVRDHRQRLVECPDRFRRRIALVVPAVALAAIPAAALLMPHASPLLWVIVGAALAGGMTVAALICLVSKPTELVDTRPFVRQSRCGCCRYQLRDLPPESDGCTICPECGGAWKLGAGGVGASRCDRA